MSTVERTENDRGPADPADPVRRELFGFRIDALTMEGTVRRCLLAVERNEPIEVGVVNAAKIVAMRRDPDLFAAVTGCDPVLADGQSVVWASRVLRRPLPERVAGIDLFTNLLAAADRDGLGVYFLGARAEVLDLVLARVRERYPNLRIAGSQHGYYDQNEAPEIAERIAAAETDLLFLGMTSPKKEIFTAKYGATTGAKVIHGVGGSFDILAGVTKRAPRSWQRLGFEWLYRAIQEPRRMTKRYLTTNTAFLILVARELVHRGGTSTSASGSS